MSEKETSDIKTLARVISLQFEDVKRRLDDQREDFKERLEKSDAHFDRRIEKLETEFSKEIKDLGDRIHDKNVDIAVLKKESENSNKNWGGLVGLIAGSVASIIVTVITKALGL